MYLWGTLNDTATSGDRIRNTGTSVSGSLSSEAMYEIRVNGVTVELYDSTGTLLDTKITQNDSEGNPGYYLFNELYAGKYKVKFVPDTTQYILTQQKATEPNGSRLDPETGYTNTITLETNASRTDIDAGVFEQVCTAPLIHATNQCILPGSTFDPMSGVTATDCEGNDITADIKIIFNDVNTGIEGKYSVTYQVSDSKGQKTTVIIQVIVCQNSARYQAISDLIESIAKEELALASILDAEAQKVQKAIDLNLSTNELMLINCSIESTIKAITLLEMILQSKLEGATSSLDAENCCEINE